MNPEELRNTKTGVFIGACYSESEFKWLYETQSISSNSITGCSRAMLANRISHWLGVTGPSYTVDTACSSSLYALEHAYRAIRDGVCDAAIVGGANLCLTPHLSLHFMRLGVLSLDGIVKSFDSKANGYARSEAIVVCFLQKAKTSRRVHAQIVHAKTNCDGYKEQGITYPGASTQKLLMQEFYEECDISPNSVEYVEAHSTGTPVGDPEELSAIDEIFCAGRKGPLMIGSIKSNLGHTEPSSGLCSIAKLTMAYNTGYIPPNINYTSPRREVAALMAGRFKVITEKSPWNRGLSALNNFGFGGANAHVLLGNFAQKKINNSLPFDDLPRLVCISGRTKSAVARVLDDLQSKPVDIELVRLYHAVHEKNISRHNFRGYVVLESRPNNSVPLARDIRYFSGVRGPMWFVYSGVGSQWIQTVTQLMRIPVFAAAIEICQKSLEHKGIDLMKILKSSDAKTKDNIDLQVGVTVLHVGLTYFLSYVGVEPDHVVGIGLGKLSCTFTNSCLEQIVLSTYNKVTELDDMMTSVSTDEILHMIEDDAIIIEIGCAGILHDSLEKSRVNVALAKEGHADNAKYLITALGRLYECGLNPKLANIYPHIQFPVSQGTPMMGHLVEWDHSENWNIARDWIEKTCCGERVVRVSIAEEEFEYLAGHVIGGHNVYPGTGYLVLVWETFSMIMDKDFIDVSVVFEDVRFQRITSLAKDNAVNFTIIIQEGSGNFEITESGASIVTGRIYAKKNVGQGFKVLPSVPEITDPNVKHLLTKDFYKFFRLRGYGHKGLFQGVLQSNVEGTHSRITWNNNWVTFLDYMLQLKVIHHDRQNLCLPTQIDRVSIDVKMHYKAVHEMKSETSQTFDVRLYPDFDIIRSGGVEIVGINFTPVSKKSPSVYPVLETNEFVPYFTRNKLKMDQILTINLQLAIENIQANNVKIVELVDEEYKNNGLLPLIEIVETILANIPLTTPELLVISQSPIEMASTNITVENNKLSMQSNNIIFIGSNLLQRSRVLHEAFDTLRENGYVLSREKFCPEQKDYVANYVFITIYCTGDEYLCLFRKKIKTNPTEYIKITSADETFSWIARIKKVLSEKRKVVLYNQYEESCNGLLGLVKCLRKEYAGDLVHAMLIADSSAPPFEPNLEFYKKQLSKTLAVNVFREGQWGTYSFFKFKELQPVPVTHAYMKVVTTGDLSSLRWLEGPLGENHNSKIDDIILVRVYCSALNFRDVMAAIGRINIELLGAEVVGKTANGSRVMAMVDNKGITNLVEADKTLTWSIPDEWSLEEASTIPIAYSTVYYAMVIIGKLKRKESVLIHAGSGGVGQAAINLALRYDCEVFTTVGTAQKRVLLKRLFPKLKDTHIGNSRDESFEDMIQKETKGNGVDIVLNSLSDEKLQASVRCLGFRGRFLEIGKFDISNNTHIGMNIFLKEVSFHGVNLEYIFEPSQINLRKELKQLMTIGINNGTVRPLTYCTFEKDEVETALRYMASGKHIGKVIIKIREENQSSEPKKLNLTRINAVKRYLCNESSVYVLVGGLGGIGLELADWLIARGAKKLLLTSRRSVSNGYQSLKLRSWATRGVLVQISTHDVTIESGCADMLKMANTMGQVQAIFNLAVVLKDAVFQNQNAHSFKIACAPKVLATIQLDKLSRILCPNLKDFVVFSSIVSGRGNLGQSNYGFANSVMERICEDRKQLGLPALAVQWGAVGDVGLLADEHNDENPVNIGGTSDQSISSCLEVLDQFLKQDSPIVSSIVIVKKIAQNHESNTMEYAVAHIMGFKDLKRVPQQVCLAELGMDSVMAVEIKQTLERDFELFLTMQDIRALKFANLTHLTGQHKSGAITSSHDSSVVKINNESNMLLSSIGEEELAYKPCIYLSTVINQDENFEEMIHNEEDMMFMIPGVEGCAEIFKIFSQYLNIKVCVLQLGFDNNEEDLEAMVGRLYQIVISRISLRRKFILLGYSYGCPLVIRLAAELENIGYRGVVFCVDGSPDYNHSFINTTFDCNNNTSLQNSVICHIVKTLNTKVNINTTFIDELKRIECFEERIEHSFNIYPIQWNYSKKFAVAMIKSLYSRIKANNIDYDIHNVKKLESPIVLLRCKDKPPQIICNENYGLDKYTEDLTVHYLESNHVKILENKQCAELVNSIILNIDSRYHKL